MGPMDGRDGNKPTRWKKEHPSHSGGTPGLAPRIDLEGALPLHVGATKMLYYPCLGV